jgi:hypothetical protein
MLRNIALFAILLIGCAMTRARVTDIGAGHYMVTSGGNGYANRADTEQRAVEEAVKVCAPQQKRPVFDNMSSGSSEMAVATANASGGSASYVQRPNSVVYFHCN